MPSKQRCQSPGRANCQLNYPLQEQVVEVNVLEKVKEARQQVLEQYGADVMGLRGPQWINSSLVVDSKYCQTASDEHLANQLLSSSFVATHLRATQTVTQVFDKQRCHAFTRTEAASGWNQSTEVSRREQRHWQQQLDGKARRASVKRMQKLKQYISLPQREEAFSSSLRSSKEEAASQEARLIKQYGPEGAAAMQHILTLKAPDRPPVRIKATAEDRQAVMQLPSLGLVD